MPVFPLEVGGGTASSCRAASAASASPSPHVRRQGLRPPWRLSEAAGCSPHGGSCAPLQDDGDGRAIGSLPDRRGWVPGTRCVATAARLSLLEPCCSKSSVTLGFLAALIVTDHAMCKPSVRSIGERPAGPGGRAAGAAGAGGSGVTDRNAARRDSLSWRRSLPSGLRKPVGLSHGVHSTRGVRCHLAGPVALRTDSAVW